MGLQHTLYYFVCHVLHSVQILFPSASTAYLKITKVPSIVLLNKGFHFWPGSQSHLSISYSKFDFHFLYNKAPYLFHNFNIKNLQTLLSLDSSLNLVLKSAVSQQFPLWHQSSGKFFSCCISKCQYITLASGSVVERLRSKASCCSSICYITIPLLLVHIQN